MAKNIADLDIRYTDHLPTGIRRYHPQQLFDLLPEETQKRIDLRDFRAILRALDELVLEHASRASAQAALEYEVLLRQLAKG